MRKTIISIFTTILFVTALQAILDNPGSIVYGQTYTNNFDDQNSIAGLHTHGVPAPIISTVAGRTGLDPNGDGWHNSGIVFNTAEAIFSVTAGLQVSFDLYMNTNTNLWHRIEVGMIATDFQPNAHPDWETNLQERAPRGEEYVFVWMDAIATTDRMRIGAGTIIDGNVDLDSVAYNQDGWNRIQIEILSKTQLKIYLNGTYLATTEREDRRDLYGKEGYFRLYGRSSRDPVVVDNLEIRSGSSGGSTPDTPNAAQNKIYWTDGEPGKIQRANLDGTNIEDLVTGLPWPLRIALDVSEGKMYWTNSHTDKIQRANLDGTNIEDLVTRADGLRVPGGIALDVQGGKMYWTDRDGYAPAGYTSKIQRANLDGTNIEDLITTGLREPYGLALDISSGKMYWVDYTTHKIQCANMDGTNVETLVTGLNSPPGIALDISSGKIYWTNRFGDKIQRANLDGTNVETVVTGLSGLQGLALDISSDKIYWAESETGKIQRANLDGTNIEDLVTGLTIPQGIALDLSGGSPESDPDPEPDTSTPEATTDATVSITPTSVASPAIGQKLEFRLNITGGKAVAGYQASVQFDTTALRFVSGANGTYLPADSFFVKPKVEGNLVRLNAASLAGESNGDGTLTTLTFEVLAVKASTLTLSDVLLSNSAGVTSVPHVENAEITESTRLKEDVNGDGVVNIADLVLVAGALNKTGQKHADVNGDGVVNIADLVLVAGALNTSAAAPSLDPQLLSTLTAADVKQWLSQAQQLNLTDNTSLRGVQFLEQLLAVLTPKKTTLLPNYPNPFNPETWIPYHLAKDADVTLHIYAMNGTLVRTLAIGHQAAGVYQSRSRAAYWDGKNTLGESVASGVYFYVLKAGDFSATRKMLILK